MSEQAAKKSHVLIVDDILENIKVLSNILYEKGLSITIARNGIQALKNVSLKKPDLILLDISMPEMDGFEVCEHLKENSETRSIPIIFITARTNTDDIVKGFHLGAVDYVTKPFNPTELVTRVFTQLELKRSRDKMAEYIDIINQQNTTLSIQNNRLELNNQLLDKQNEELKILNATKDKFFSIIAHDLKNPFNALIGFSEFLTMYYDKMSEEKVKLYHKNIHQSALQGFYLLQNLLEWSRSQTGRLKWNPTELKINDMVEDTFELLSNNASAKNIDLVKDFDKECKVYADDNMLHTVLRNLVANAIKFTPQNGKVTIKAVSKVRTVHISISDTGVGISKEDLQKLFRIDVHHSTKGTSNEAGTGLGLLLCKEFIEKCGGQIWVKSEIDKGSVFNFTLPTSKEFAKTDETIQDSNNNNSHIRAR